MNNLCVDESKVVTIAGKGLKLNSASDVEELIKEIEKCQNLNLINFEGNTIGIKASESIGLALKNKSTVTSANFKDIFTGRLKTEIPFALAHLTNGLSNSKLTQLDLSDNAFGYVAIEALNPFLKSTCCQSLKSLHLSNNGIGIEGGILLADALKHLTCLEVFCCGRNRLENEAVFALSASLSQLTSLQVLELPQNGINHKAMSAIGKVVQSNSNLKVLNLNDNTITPKGAAKLALSLQKASNLKSINFGDCLLKTKGCFIVLYALKKNGVLYNLNELNLGNNEIGGDEIKKLLKSVFSIKNLQNHLKLDLSCNNFGKKACEDLKSSLNKCVYVNLSDDEGHFDEEDESDDGDDDYDENDDDEEFLEREEEKDEEKKNSQVQSDKTIKEVENKSVQIIKSFEKVQVQSSKFVSDEKNDKLIDGISFHAKVEECVNNDKKNRVLKVDEATKAGNNKTKAFENESFKDKLKVKKYVKPNVFQVEVEVNVNGDVNDEKNESSFKNTKEDNDVNSVDVSMSELDKSIIEDCHQVLESALHQITTSNKTSTSLNSSQDKE